MEPFGSARLTLGERADAQSRGVLEGRSLARARSLPRGPRDATEALSRDAKQLGQRWQGEPVRRN